MKRIAALFVLIFCWCALAHAQGAYTAKAQPDQTLGTRIHIVVTLTYMAGSVVTYERWVDQSDWNADPNAVTAAMASFKDAQVQTPAATPVAVDPKAVPAVSMSATDVQAKVTAIAAAAQALSEPLAGPPLSAPGGSAPSPSLPNTN